MRPRFDLAALMIAVTLWCGFWTLARLFGIGNVILFGLIPALLVIFWALLYKLAPDATFYFSFFGVIGVCCFSLFASSLLNAREETRRVNSTNDLRKLGHIMQVEGGYSGFRKHQNRRFTGTTILE